MIEFSDGETVDTDGKLRVEKGPEGYYVVGDGIFMSFDREVDAQAYLYDIESKNIFCYWKMFRSPVTRKKVRDAEEREQREKLIS
ncbi:hypothetical protein [Sediminispirochaeta bajacaliforniensis]|uniref:hypothetical protein n=1 Tax=Sediminispirochaeta bajacaliforniensis TaxID=148 RepID=UPI00037CA7C1|nr:hypothetical protein [Sediminispirochaeta bajacaliforniensis]